MSAPPRVLTVAGSDSGGGAGIQADLKTMLALGVHGMSVVTAVTAQNSLGVQGAWELPAEAVRGPVPQRRRRHRRPGREDRHARLRRTGGDGGRAARRHRTRRSSSTRSASPSTGTRCSPPRRWTSVRTKLLPVATVATPNLDEVAQLTGVRGRDEAGMRAGRRRRAGVRAALGADQGRASAPATRWTCSPTAPRSTGCAPRATTTGTPTARAAPSPRAIASRPREGAGRAGGRGGGQGVRHRARSPPASRSAAGIGPVDHAWRRR